MLNIDATVNKLITLEDKIREIETIAKILNIWVKDDYYELIPIIKMLNNKVKNAANIFKK